MMTDEHNQRGLATWAIGPHDRRRVVPGLCDRIDPLQRQTNRTGYSWGTVARSAAVVVPGILAAGDIASHKKPRNFC